MLEIIVIKLAKIAESTTAHPDEMSANAYFLPRAMSTCVLQANVIIRGVVVLDVRWVFPNCRLDNMVHINMEVRCFTELPTF